MAPNRTIRIRFGLASAEVSLTSVSPFHLLYEFSCGMIFRIADNFHPSTVRSHHIAFGNGILRVVGAFRLHVRADVIQQRAHIQLWKDNDRIHWLERRQYFS